MGCELSRILLVEDNPADANLVRHLLVDAHIVHVATLGAARKALQREAFGVVLLDLGLPDARGMESLDAITAEHAGTPIIVLTGLDDADLGDRAIARGAQDYLPKGMIDSDRLARAIRYAMGRARLDRRLRAVVANNVDAMVVVGAADRTIKFVNRAAEVLFGPAIVGTVFGYALDDGSVTEVDVVSDDKVASVEMRVAPIEWDGEPAHLASIRDVTERKRLETQLKVSDRMATVGTMAAGIAHEINNPLTALMWNLEIVRQGNESEMLSQAQDAAERIAKIVTSMRTFSRADAHNPVAIDARQALQSAIRMTANEVKHCARLEKRFDPIPCIEADESRLVQVFVNLIVNAAQAFDDKRDDNVIRIVTRTSDTGDAVIEIYDNGPGIAPAIRARIFDPFFTTKAIGSGTGLGLAISERLVADMAGAIACVPADNTDRGTVFRVTLPPTEQPSSAEVATRPAKKGSKKRGRVLIIDDEQLVNDAAKALLTPEHDVRTAESGAEGLSKLELDDEVDVIICDVMMPGMSGIAFYEQLQALFPPLIDKVVFMTGGAFSPQARASLQRIPNLCLAKPCEPGRLRALVRSMVG